VVATMSSSASRTRAARPDADRRLELMIPTDPHEGLKPPPFDKPSLAPLLASKCAKLAQSYNIAAKKAKIRRLPKR
jgi:hypothetical protein